MILFRGASWENGLVSQNRPKINRSAIPLGRTTPKFIQEIADSVFGDKEFLPLTVFMSKTGMSREIVLGLHGLGLLDVFQYQPNKYRKIIVAKTSFIRFLKKTSLRIIN